MKKSRGKTRNDSVLKRQKPRTKRSFWARPAFAVTAFSTVAVIVLVLGYRSFRLFTKSEHRANTEVREPWQFTLKLSEDLPLSSAAQDQIIATARDAVGSGSLAELTKAGLAIQRQDAYADVRLAKLSATMIAISVVPRHAALCIDADRWRYISTEGDIYGQVAEGQANACPGPTLTGLFERNRRLVSADNLTLILGDEEKALVKEAVVLVDEARTQGFTFGKLEVRRYRGFFGQLIPQGTEVALGRAPFAPKLDKLQGILARLAKKNEQALRIELDYQGKAFIKLKKM